MKTYLLDANKSKISNSKVNFSLFLRVDFNNQKTSKRKRRRRHTERVIQRSIMWLSTITLNLNKSHTSTFRCGATSSPAMSPLAVSCSSWIRSTCAAGSPLNPSPEHSHHSVGLFYQYCTPYWSSTLLQHRLYYSRPHFLFYILFLCDTVFLRYLLYTLLLIQTNKAVTLSICDFLKVQKFIQIRRMDFKYYKGSI